jgi:hypothetical protein
LRHGIEEHSSEGVLCDSSFPDAGLAANIPLQLEAQDTAAGECSRLMARVFEVTGVSDEIAAIPAGFRNRAQLNSKSDARMSESDKRRFRTSMTSAFLPEKPDAELKQEFL